MHIFIETISVLPSIIAFYLKSDNNPLYIYCHITVKVGKKLTNIYGWSFSIITINCTYKFFQLLLLTISQGDDSMNKSCTYVGLYGSDLLYYMEVICLILSYVSLPTLFAYFLSFDVPISSFIFIENVFFIMLVSIVRFFSEWCAYFA